MNEFFRRIALQPRLRLELWLSSLLINLLGLASSLYSIHVLNRYLALGVDATLVTLTLGAVMAVGFEVLLRNARLRVAQWLCARADTELGETLFEGAVRGQYALVEQLPHTARREILSGQSTVQQCFGAPNLVTLLDTPFAFVFVVVLGMLSPFLACMALLVMAGVTLVSLLAQRRLREPMEAQSRIAMQMAGYQHNLTAGGEMVRAFSAADALKEKWRACADDQAEQRAQLNRLQNTMQNASYAGTLILSMVIMGLGAREVLAGNLDIGSLIGCNILASRALAALTRALGLGEQIGRGQRALELARQLCAIPRERAEGVRLGQTRGSLRFEDMAFGYPKQAVPVLEHFDYSLEAGKVLVFTGANGSGKTTLARLLVGLLEPSRGHLLVDGMDLRQADPQWWRRQVAYLPQEPQFFDGTLRENLCVLAPETADAKVLELCRELAVGAFVEGGAEGLGLVVRNGGGSIPLGIRRRLALVRAVLGGGQLVVLDDPTEGVDAEGCKAIAALLSRLVREGRTLVMMSNESFILGAADTVIDLNHKPVPRVLRDGKPAREGVQHG
ncbi:ATP-binding cassette subfamily C protein LapB [Ectopseudomonas oleovorans]|uniref:ATP-binding cassette subfamily C protein LapB n=2 Tax=Pseudomonadaceae TaxID=135621 RepID=A0A397M0X0_ECTOL|nr:MULTISPECIES: ATP-binding cassette domain-containing protein [Pseudomonas]QMV65536.1 ATP-binding cassette domain-containing protein [Pseudomonas berkeleyensis]RIA18620.1 ATP-binding cassette subfamily C protein LapB [Pseudomonas oleovorans]WSO41015.1 ATP-binding cassette domain-containing protein [Pseudomonas berkeleyensis]